LWTRRIATISAAVAAVALLPGRTGEARPAASSVETLTYPPVLKNISSLPNTVEVNLTAEPTVLNLLPGKSTEVWAYNGSVPGPSLEAREGDEVIVHFRNNLPPRDEEGYRQDTTIHWHGLHIPVPADGNPMDPIAPGGSYDYRFTVPPGSAGTYWYHPHPHEITGHQVARSLVGAIIVRANDDPLPASIPEKLLVLSDNRFHEDGSLADVGDLLDLYDLRNGREGEVAFVNGQINPTLAIRSGEVQRWRVINASIARYYRLSLKGHTFLHVGSDGGLFERPAAVDEQDGILLSPAERVELLVQGSSEPGSRTVLQSLPYDRYDDETRPKGVDGLLDWDQPLDLLTVQYTDEPRVSPVAIPEILRPVPALDPATASATHQVGMSVESELSINGGPFRGFDMGRVDLTAPLNATEIWTIVSPPTGDGVMDHPFHLHGFSFQILDWGRTDNSGQPDFSTRVPAPFPAWKDSFNVPRNGWVRFIVQYTDYPGKRMFHCHILGHEDRGMMGILEVVP
jgi:bilirubin oxidase